MDGATNDPNRYPPGWDVERVKGITDLSPAVLEKLAAAWKSMYSVFIAAAEAVNQFGAALTDAIEKDPELRAYIEALADDEADEPVVADSPALAPAAGPRPGVP